MSPTDQPIAARSGGRSPPQRKRVSTPTTGPEPPGPATQPWTRNGARSDLIGLVGGHCSSSAWPSPADLVGLRRRGRVPSPGSLRRWSRGLAHRPGVTLLMHWLLLVVSSVFYLLRRRVEERPRDMIEHVPSRVAPFRAEVRSGRRRILEGLRAAGLIDATEFDDESRTLDAWGQLGATGPGMGRGG